MMDEQSIELDKHGSALTPECDEVRAEETDQISKSLSQNDHYDQMINQHDQVDLNYSSPALSDRDYFNYELDLS